jgi:hypothetical protein
MALPREVAKEVCGETRRPARVHEEAEQACACQMPLHKRQHLGIEQSADVLEELSHTAEPWSTSAGIRFTRAASQCPVGMWIGREFAAATSRALYSRRALWNSVWPANQRWQALMNKEGEDDVEAVNAS